MSIIFAKIDSISLEGPSPMAAITPLVMSVFAPGLLRRPRTVPREKLVSAACGQVTDIIRKDIRVGDTVKVRVKPGSLPEVLEVVFNKRPADAVSFQSLLHQNKTVTA